MTTWGGIVLGDAGAMRIFFLMLLMVLVRAGGALGLGGDMYFLLTVVVLLILVLLFQYGDDGKEFKAFLVGEGIEMGEAGDSATVPVLAVTVLSAVVVVSVPPVNHRVRNDKDPSAVVDVKCPSFTASGGTEASFLGLDEIVAKDDSSEDVPAFSTWTNASPFFLWLYSSLVLSTSSLLLSDALPPVPVPVPAVPVPVPPIRPGIGDRTMTLFRILVLLEAERCLVGMEVIRVSILLVLVTEEAELFFGSG
jgi:hypothetical protein